MQNNNDQMGKTKEVPSVMPAKKPENDDNITKDQQSLFDAEDAFSEAVVVEKEAVEIGNELLDEADGGEKSVSAKDLEDSARGYYDATHSGSIEDKVNELCKRASEGFDYDLEDEEEQVSEQNAMVKEIFSEDAEKRRKKDRKNRKKGRISDEDMEMLAGGIPKSRITEEKSVSEPVAKAEEYAEEEKQENVQSESLGVEYVNPLGTDNDEEENDEDDKLFKLLAGSKKIDAVYDEEENEAEYTDRNQEETILSELRSGAIFSALSVVLTLVVTGLCIYFELASGTKLPHPAFFEAGKFGVTYLMCMLQLMFFAVIFNFDGMKRAIRGFKASKTSTEVFAAATVGACTIHSILSAVFASDSPELRSFCSIGCMALLILSINSFMKAYTSLSSFCIAASKAPKLSSVNLERTSGEAAAFEKYLDSDTEVFTVGKSDFVDGFFKKTRAVPRAGRSSFRMVLVSFMVAVVLGVVCGMMSGVYAGVTAFTTVCLAAFPVNALLATVLPFFAVSQRAKKTQTAYIGEAACDAYENAGVISFEDTEVFPAKSVKVSSIRTYSDNRIDKIILYMARVFAKVKGPLSFVFANSVQSVDDGDVSAQITEQFSDGISARIDGKEILVGTENFMKLYDIETPVDNIDESFTRSLGSIMFMSVDGSLAAKFYIKYTMSRGFESILRSFYDAGICVGIRSLDPCVTTELVCGNLKGSNYPVAVIKKHKEPENPDPERTEGAVVTLSGVHNFLKGFIRLDNLRNVYRSNMIVSTFSMIVGIILAAVLNFTGVVEISVVMLLLFQLLWCVPTVIMSLLSK